MTDRELLEMAAKAARIQNYTMRGDTLFVETGAARGDSGYYWNPLVDDGHALRLAAALDIVPRVINGVAFAWHDVCDMQEPCGTDPYAAIRRAITRAAAEIGKDMR